MRGQSLAEYSLILALIAVVAIAALVLLGTSVANDVLTMDATI
jgi:Flp pilus assembly pilin Flp